MSATKKSKRDGTVLNSKAQICLNYDESSLPWPLRPILRLDYCWRLTYTMWKHSFYLAVPLTGVHYVYYNMPQCWSLTRKTFPKLLITINYVACVLLINSVNVCYSLVFEDYCDRNSLIYNV
jgi:hypothetical protein